MKPLISIKPNKKVLVRLDINSPLKNKKILDNEKFNEIIPTINYLLKKNSKIVLIAHQGRKGSKDYTSLQQHQKILQKHLKRKIQFLKFNKSLDNKLKNLKSKEILLLENVRSLTPESKLYKLAKYFDYFVFEAFAVSHHPAPSVTGLQEKLPTLAGLNYQREINHLKKLKTPKYPYVVILGGAKPLDLLPLLKSKKIDIFLVSGVLGELFTVLHGHHLGEKEKILKKQGHLKLLSKLRRYKKSKKIILPLDFAIDIKGKRQDISIEELPSKYLVKDIGSKTIRLFKSYIKRANTIYYKGPQGFYEERTFQRGTKELLLEISKSKAFTIAGGGHSYTAITKFIKPSKINYLSTAGGALLHYILKK